MAHGTRRPAGRDVLQRGEVVFVPVGMGHELEAHRRHPDEIGDLLFFDQPQRLARVPLGHHHHAAADDEAVEHYRDLAGDVEQGHAQQGARRRRGSPPFARQHPEQAHQPDRISVGPGRDRAMGRQGGLGVPGRSRGEQQRRIVLRQDLGEAGGLADVAQQAGQRLFDGQLDRKADDVA